MDVKKPAQSDTGSVAIINSEALFKRESLLDLLVAIRGSGLTNEDKTEVRDLVLEYAKAGANDDSDDLQSAILKIISKDKQSFQHLLNKKQVDQIKPDATKETPQSSHNNHMTAIGRSRPTPSFEQITPAATKTEHISQEVVEKAAPTTQPEAAKSEPDPAPLTPPVSKETEPVEPVVNKEVLEKEPISTVPSYSGAATEVTAVGEDPQERIKQIKHDINEKVGNPVNLMSINSQIGKEYLDALLDAMKKSTGGIGGIDAAMARLEAAYQAAIKTLGDNKVEKASKIETSETNQVVKEPEKSTPAPAPVKAEAISPVEETTKEPLTWQPPREREETDKKTSPKAEPETKSEDKPEPEPVPVTKPKPESQPVSLRVDKKSDVPEVSDQNSKPEVVDEGEAVVVPKPTVNQIEEEPRVAVPPNSPNSLSSLANSVKLKREDTTVSRPQPEVPPQTEATEAPVSAMVPKPERETVVESSAPIAPARRDMQPLGSGENTQTEKSELVTSQPKTLEAKLQSENVTNGLDQLLNEWKLFMRSGVLGMGPHGREHPLYKKLASLPMASIVSGRFEGATPEIKQTLSDYIKGWRYEQHVAHNVNESFEHYLRRVILHIIENNQQPNS